MRLRKTLLRTLVATASLAAAFPAAADAGTLVLRPDGNVMTGWTVNPVGTQHWDVLNDPVTSPTAPSTASDYLTATSGSALLAKTTMTTAAIPAGENVTAVTAWAYLQTGSSRTITLWATAAGTSIGSATIPAGSAAGWYSVALTSPLTQSQIDAIELGYTHSGGTGTANFVYASYIQVDTVNPTPPPADDPPPSDPPPSDPPPSDPPPTDPTPTDPTPTDPTPTDPTPTDPTPTDPTPTDPTPTDPTPTDPTPTDPTPTDPTPTDPTPTDPTPTDPTPTDPTPTDPTPTDPTPTDPTPADPTPTDPTPTDPTPTDPTPTDPTPTDPTPTDPTPTDSPVDPAPTTDPVPTTDPLPTTDPVPTTDPTDPVPTTDPTDPIVPDVSDDVLAPALAVTGSTPTVSTQGDVRVQVGCAPEMVDGCEGVMWLEEPLDVSAGRLVAARRTPKRFSKTKKYKLRPGQKKTVPIRLDRRTYRKFKKKRSFKVAVVAQQKGPQGQVLTQRRTFRVYNSKKKRR